VSEDTSSAEATDEGFVIDPTPLQRIAIKEKALADELAEVFGLERGDDFRGQPDLQVPVGKLSEVLKRLRDDPSFSFETLTDLTAVDYLKQDGHPERFAVVYILSSAKHNARLRLRVYIDEEDPALPTASRLWGAADWAEREVFDMFGIVFHGHSNLERILMPLDFGSHPLRKDYPLRGRGERDDFPRLRRGDKEDV